MSKIVRSTTIREINRNNNQVIEDGESLMEFLSLQEKLNDEEKENIRNSTIEILKKCIPSKFNNNNKENNTGIVIGKIQSGKTLSFTSLICLANDNEYKIIIIIAGRTELLLGQTIDRLTKDLIEPDKLNSKFSLITSLDFSADETSQLKTVHKLKKSFKYNRRKKRKTIIIPILKHQKHIQKLKELFMIDNNYLKKSSVLIIDDEADQASLNTQAKKNRIKNLNNESTIYNSIKNLRNELPNHSYIEYTATPIANLLLSKISLMSPEWKVLLKPGLKYTGGNEFFNEKKNIIRKIKKEKESKDGKIYPPDIKHLKEYPDSLFDSVNEFIILASLKTLFDKDQGDIKEFNKKASMLIHPTHLVRETEKNPVTINTFYNWTDQIIETIESRVNGNDYEALEEKYKEVNKDMINLKLFKNFPTFNELKSIIQEIVFDDEVNVHRVIGGVLEKNVKPPWKKYKYNILIGGALLDRGFTIDNLILTYMPRDSKAKNQADTIEQRCRFYGYRKNYIDFCRVYLTEGLKDDYVSYNKTEDYLFETLEKNTMEEFKSLNSLIRLDEKLKPTNLSRIDTELYRTNLSQFKNFNPQFKDHDHNNKLIEDFIELIGNNYDGSRKVLKPKDEYCGKETNNYTHLVSKVSLDDVNNHLLSKFKFNNYEETILRDSYVDLLKEMLKAENKKVYIIEIAPYRDHRPRRIIYKKDDYSNHYKLGVPLYFGGIKKYGAIFADRDLIKNKEKTPSTEIFNYDNEIIIQIHKNISKIKNNEFDATKFYTLAIYNPNKIEGFIRTIES